MTAARRAAACAGQSVLLLLIVSGLVVPTSSAYHTGIVMMAGPISETITLPRNNYSGYTFAMGNGEIGRAHV